VTPVSLERRRPRAAAGGGSAACGERPDRCNGGPCPVARWSSLLPRPAGTAVLRYRRWRDPAKSYTLFRLPSASWWNIAPAIDAGPFRRSR